MKEYFQDKNFRNATLGLIELINSILDEYNAAGYDLSLRQLYYQLVSRDYIPNSQRSYNQIGRIVSDGRLAGLIDWNMIVDRGRGTVSNTHWNSPAEIVESAARQFRIDKWKDQPCHIEVMVEKQALEGVLIPVCKKLDVNFTANKGYSSQSMMYLMGKTLRHQARHNNKEIAIFYLGDHDPSGLDMDRDIKERLELFSGLGVVVKRLALKYEQIEELKPPENPAKLTDTRAKGYVRLYGYSSWELDAIEPKELDKLVTDAVESQRDPDLWDDSVKKEKAMKKELRGFATDYKKKN
jgi:hypothetical protein